jgi:DNA-binding GntR family transcriptional regulator
MAPTSKPTTTTRRPRRKEPAATAAKGSSLVMKAFEELKEKIITLYFLPGQYLNEGALCALLGMGRTPVHQALHRLQLEGLVEIMPRKGVIVQPDSIAEILKILDSRVTVEAELARNAAENATPQEAEDLKVLARASYGNGTASEIDAFISGDRAFHRKFAELAANPVLRDFARTLHERSIRYWYLHLWQTMDNKATIRQHSAIAVAIANRDGDAAAKAVREHIESLRSRLMRAQQMSQRPAPPLRPR